MNTFRDVGENVGFVLHATVVTNETAICFGSLADDALSSRAAYVFWRENLVLHA